MYIKKLSIMVIMFVFSIGILTAGVLAVEPEVEWTFAHPHPMEHPWGEHGQMLVDLIEERSEGRFEITYHPGGVLGSESDIFDQVAAGAVELMLSGPSAMEGFYPPISIVQAYYVFRDIDHIFAAMEEPVLQDLFREAREASGIRTLNIWYYGTRQLTTNFPVHGPEDLENRKIRSSPASFSQANINAMGAVATPVDFAELYMALQTGVVEGQENPLPTIKAQAFHEVQDYLILTNHNVHPGNIIVNEEAFQSLPNDLREILIEVSDEVALLVAEAISREEEELMDFFQENMTVIEPDVEAFREKVHAELLEKYEDVWGEGTLEKIQAVK